MKVKINLSDSDKMIEVRGLGRNGDVQKHFTHTVRRLSDPYVPFRNGVLKRTAIEKNNSIEYVQPYARRQWYENKGHGLRGKQWTLRMWQNRGPEIIASVKKKAGL